MPANKSPPYCQSTPSHRGRGPTRGQIHVNFQSNICTKFCHYTPSKLCSSSSSIAGSDSDSDSFSSDDTSSVSFTSSGFSSTSLVLGGGYPASNGGCEGSYTDGAENVSVPLMMAAIRASRSILS